jgi:glycosyltransferase involved in cell wall biosynthesis
MRDSLAPCANQVEWLGFQPWTEMPAALAKGAILCLPSRYDGWGLALVEGLAAGLPAIGTDKTGSAVELLSDHQAGWLIPASDADALANTMEIALKLDDSAFHAKQLAARKAPQRLDAIPAATQFLTLCQETLLQASKS